MEEKILVSGKVKNPNPLIAVPIVLFIATMIYILNTTTTHVYLSVKTYYLDDAGDYIFIALTVIAVALYIFCLNCEITISDKRIYGTAMFMKKVDVPIESIAFVNLTGFLNCISVATGSGTIKFYALANANEIYVVGNDLLKNRKYNIIN